MSEYQETKSYLIDLIPRIYLEGMEFEDLNKFEQEKTLSLFISESSDKQVINIVNENDCQFCEPDFLRKLIKTLYLSSASIKEILVQELMGDMRDILISMFVGTNEYPGQLRKLFEDLVGNYEIFDKPLRRNYETENWPCY